MSPCLTTKWWTKILGFKLTNISLHVQLNTSLCLISNLWYIFSSKRFKNTLTKITLDSSIVPRFSYFNSSVVTHFSSSNIGGAFSSSSLEDFETFSISTMTLQLACVVSTSSKVLRYFLYVWTYIFYMRSHLMVRLIFLVKNLFL